MTVSRAGPFRVLKPWEEFDHTPFQGLPPETWSAELYYLNELIDAVVAARCLEILAELGVPAPSHLDMLADDLAVGAGVLDERAYAFHWLLRRLAASGMLRGDPGGEINDLDPSPWEAQELSRAAEEAAPRLGTTLALIDHVARHYPAWLRGELSGARVLFSREALALWEGYFHQGNLTCAAVNALAAGAAERAVQGDALRVLEVGGGLGSGAEALLTRIGPRIESYTFTEVAPVFLSRGEACLRQAYPELALTCQRVDLNRPLGEQGLQPASYELIFAVNTLHAVRDLVATLTQLRGLLSPSGALVLGESVKPTPSYPVAAEFIFQLTREFQAVVAEPGVRDRGGFLQWEGWPLALERAGFPQPELFPEPARALASYPNYTLTAVVAARSS